MGKKSTSVDLVRVLEERNKGGKLDRIINEARLNHFHDFKSPIEIASPKGYLIEQLSVHPELEDIMKAVIAGDYDEEPTITET